MRALAKPTQSIEEIFLEELQTRHARAQQAFQVLERSPSNVPATKVLLDFFHSVAGTALPGGHPMLGHLAAACEVAARLAVHQPTLGASLVSLFESGLAGAADVLREARAAQPLPPGTDASTSSFQSEDPTEAVKVLVIDDDRTSIAMIDAALGSAGFEAVSCTDPQRAVMMVESELPDLILMDVMMPGINGLDVCRRVRQHPDPVLQTIPVIFVTRMGDVDQRVQGLEAGANDYLLKPFSPVELVARVRAQLSRQAALRELAIRDGLTHCFNHKYFKVRLTREIERARRHGTNMSLALLDVDFFKKINDEHGHPAGDSVLTQVAAVVLETVRGTDLVARYGGEEFGVLFLQTGRGEAAIVADRIRERVANGMFPAPTGSTRANIPVTLSLGVSSIRPDDTAESLLRRADEALYEAKKTGRNRVCLAPDGES